MPFVINIHVDLYVSDSRWAIFRTNPKMVFLFRPMTQVREKCLGHYVTLIYVYNDIILDLSEEISSSADDEELEDDDESSDGESSILSEDISDESSSESEDIELQLGALEHERQKILKKLKKFELEKKRRKLKKKLKREKRRKKMKKLKKVFG